MKKNKVAFRKGTFTDYAGNKRPYVFAAVSVATGNVAVVEEDIDHIEFSPKTLNIGLSVLHPDDLARTKLVNGIETPVYTEQLGEEIAYGKAINPRSRCGRVIVDRPGLINTSVVEAILEQEEAHFLAHPGNYIAGYEKARVNYNFAKLGGEELLDKIDDKVDELDELHEELDRIYEKSYKTKA